MIRKDSNKIGLIGYGQLGVQVENFLLSNNKYKNDIIYFDDFLHSKYPGENNIKKFEEFRKSIFYDLNFFVCLGYLHLKLKKEIIDFLIQEKRKLPNLIHETCYIDRSIKIGKGNILYPMVNIDFKVEIGNGNLLNNNCVISHNSKIDDCCYLSPLVCLNGFAKIKSCSFVGSNSTISNNVEVGRNSTVGIKTNLTKSIEDGSKVIGNPFKFVKSIKLS